MTKEELKQEAEEYVYKALGFDKDYIKQELNRKYNPIEPWEKSEPIDPIINETMEAYLAGAKPREKRIAELEAQIEKMKCCYNCKHFDKLYNLCELTRFTLKKCLCNSLDKWEIKEND